MAAGRDARGTEFPARRTRRRYLDWMRGLAVLIMIEAHLLDAWTATPYRGAREFGWAMILGGMGAPLFLFLAGVAVPMSAGSKLRRSGNADAASRAVARRGFEVFGLAFLFRIQAWVLGWSAPWKLLKVDILNIMGPAIAAAALLWRLRGTTRGRVAVFAAATLTIAFSTPVVRALPMAWIPDPLEAYIRPIPDLSNFVFFPWMAFVFAGGVLGTLLDAAEGRERETRLNVTFGAAGAMLAAGAFAASYLPSPYSQSYFWTTSPAFFLLRVGLMTVAVALAYAWEARPGAANSWSPVAQLGRTSLFIYWIHVDMVYGLISRDLHRALTFHQALAALVLFSLFMLACSLAKDRVVAWWRARRAQGRPLFTSGA